MADNGDLTEKVVILVAEDVVGPDGFTGGSYHALDELYKRGQCGFTSVFVDCPDIMMQLTGINYHGAEKLEHEVGHMKLSVLTDKSAYSGFGDVEKISGLDLQGIYNKIVEKKKQFNVILVELPHSLDTLNQMVELLLPGIEENVALCTLIGLKADGKKPKITQPPPCVDPSWKVIGPNVVENLSIDRPFLFASASKQLTRVDHVKAFDFDDIQQHACMGALPICQLFREFSYYTGSSWKYGA